MVVVGLKCLQGLTGFKSRIADSPQQGMGGTTLC